MQLLTFWRWTMALSQNWENPTLDQIESKLESYKASFQKGERIRKGQLLIFFSGHGAIENNVGFFLPKDAEAGRLRRSAIDYNYYRNFMDGIDCQHIFVAIDACYSVRFDPLWSSRLDNQFDRIGEKSEREKLLAKHETTTTRIFFTSDGEEQETPDRSDFAKKFQEGLLSGGGSDGILTSSELYATVSNANPSPHCSEFGKDEPGSSFLFIKEKREIKSLTNNLSLDSTNKAQIKIVQINDTVLINGDTVNERNSLELIGEAKTWYTRLNFNEDPDPPREYDGSLFGAGLTFSLPKNLKLNLHGLWGKLNRSDEQAYRKILNLDGLFSYRLMLPNSKVFDFAFLGGGWRLWHENIFTNGGESFKVTTGPMISSGTRIQLGNSRFAINAGVDWLITEVDVRYSGNKNDVHYDAIISGDCPIGNKLYFNIGWRYRKFWERDDERRISVIMLSMKYNVFNKFR